MARAKRDNRIRSLAAAALLLAAASGAWAEDAREIVLRSLDARADTYSGEQVSQVTGPLGRVSRPQRQKVFRKGDRLHVVFVPSGQEMLDDGRRLLVYLPRLNVVEEGPSRMDSRRAAAQRRALLKRRVTADLLPDGEVAGRPAYVVQLTGAGTNAPVRKIWIDKQTYVQLRLDESRTNGRTVSTYFTSIDFQAEPTPRQLALGAPPTAQRVERGFGRPIPTARAAEMARDWGGLLEPKLVPPGYTFRGYYRHVFNGRPILVSVYGREGEKNVLSVFQGPAMGMGGMVERKGGHLRVLSATKGKADVMLVAPLPEDELQKMMESVVPQQ